MSETWSTREMRNAYKILIGNFEETNLRPVITLGHILRRECMRAWFGFIWLRKGPIGRLVSMNFQVPQNAGNFVIS
jgi:hypothetical protein